MTRRRGGSTPSRTSGCRAKDWLIHRNLTRVADGPQHPRHTADMLIFMTVYVCPRCRAQSPTDALTWCCPHCRGPWDLEFASEPVSLASLASRRNSLWRYEEALPPMPYAAEVTLGEGRTPLVPLAEDAEGSVSAKLDFLMPTLSFKDRGAVMLAAHATRLTPAGGISGVPQGQECVPYLQCRPTPVVTHCSAKALCNCRCTRRCSPVSAA